MGSNGTPSRGSRPDPMEFIRPCAVDSNDERPGVRFCRFGMGMVEDDGGGLPRRSDRVRARMHR